MTSIDDSEIKSRLLDYLARVCDQADMVAPGPCPIKHMG
jgi:hypothetical protein